MPTEASHPELRIEKLVYGGDGLARSDSGVVLTPYVLAGELVRAETYRAKNDLLRGRLLGVAERSPERVDPSCPYFTRCGGCHYQHAKYPHQVDQKRAILREVLQRVGRIEIEMEIEAVSASPWQYRNRAQLHIRDGAAGYFAAGSHDLVAIDHCPISSPKLNETISQLGRELPRYRWFSATLELFTNETAVQINPLDRIPASVRPLLDGLGDGTPIEYGEFRVSRSSFFQVNRFLIEQLVDAAIGNLEGESALDLYAGVGLFAAELGKRFARVTAVESGGSAHRDLEFNMRRMEKPVEAVRANAEDYLSSAAEAPDLVVADPPRTGLGKPVIRDLLRLGPAKIAIVSCEPATLARDLRPLLDNGYAIDAIRLVDLFPQTFHLETVVRLSRRTTH